ncbi:alpha/beta hydrolase [Clostridium estertheticum]|uniref:alpha/beta fold hydrolase n=1 Tax=Clostridium estertheticum TaxID=238834 RepID=UPI0013E95F04|nr:alpha/beta hydrolase [Clostridium estertheticum]MBZ9687430.1 alpha/beta hydrolase [Clostridium estertheticum]
MKLDDSNQLDIDDVIINYHEKGQGDVLIFLHGNNLDSGIFVNLYDYFSEKYKVVAVDSRGHGSSESGEVPYSIGLFADDIITFCSKKKFTNIRVVGYSDGANIALMIAKKYPQLIDKLVIISGNYKVEGIKKWLRNILKFLIILLMPFSKYFNPVKIQKWKFDLMLDDMGISEIDLKQIIKPTLVLSAENDLIYEEHTFDIHRNIKGSFLKIIKKTNHSNIIFNNQIIKIIDEFLN